MAFCQGCSARVCSLCLGSLPNASLSLSLSLSLPLPNSNSPESALLHRNVVVPHLVQPLLVLLRDLVCVHSLELSEELGNVVVVPSYLDEDGEEVLERAVGAVAGVGVRLDAD